MSNQKNLLDFVNDPKNLDKAIEGSMEKRQAIIDQANTLTIEQRLDKALNNLRSRVDESQIEMDDDGDASYVYCTNVAFDKQKQAILQLLNETKKQGFKDGVNSHNVIVADLVNEARIDENKMYVHAIETAGLHEPDAIGVKTFKNRIETLTPKENK